jgi:phage shock protein PspC (stress-responsive transcriptional regulator)
MTNSEPEFTRPDDQPNEQSAGSTPPPPPPPAYVPQPPIPLKRSSNKILGGVVAGLAEKADIDVTIARLLAVLAFVFSAGAVTVAYVAAWILMPGPNSATAPIARWQHQPPPPA